MALRHLICHLICHLIRHLICGTRRVAFGFPSESRLALPLLSLEAGGVTVMMTQTVEHIASLATLLEDPLQEKLWEYAELLYVEQVAFESTDPSAWTIERGRDPDAFVSTDWP